MLKYNDLNNCCCSVAFEAITFKGSKWNSDAVVISSSVCTLNVLLNLKV